MIFRNKYVKITLIQEVLFVISEQKHIVFQILDVVYLEQSDFKGYNSDRNFAALSFRYEADTVIETKQKQIEMSDNSICFMPSNVNYTRTSKKDKLIAIHFICFSYQATDVECFFPAEHEKYQHLFKEILQCWNKKEDAYLHEAAAILNKIFAELYRDNGAHRSNTKIDASIDYIEKNCFKKDFSLTLAAEKSYVSDVYFRKLFKEKFHTSPKKYVIDRRMKYAAALIITGYYTLDEISEMCGYNDYKHFSVEFKKNIGISPSKYTYNFSLSN